MKKIAFIFILFFGSQASVLAANGEEILKNKCASCHDLKGPAAKTLAELWQRQGPDLFYAGSKYNADWLTTWLQAPKRIRPAGFHYVQNIKPGKKWDVVDKSKLKPHFKLNEAEADELVELATKEYEASTDYFEFTRLINDHYNEQQKIELIENLWHIAYADNILDKYEEHVIRRIADLIYVSHKDFIASKLRAKN